MPSTKRTLATLAAILLSATVGAAPAPRARPSASAALASRLDAILARAPVSEAGRLVQSWPMRGNRAELSRAELGSLILARKP